MELGCWTQSIHSSREKRSIPRLSKLLSRRRCALVISALITLVTLSKTQLAFAETERKAALVLTPQKVAEIVLQQSPKAKETRWTFQLNDLAPIEVASRFDWLTGLETGFTDSKLESLSSTGVLKDQQYLTKYLLQRNFITGTKLEFSYSRTSVKTELAANSTRSTPPNQTQDLLGLKLEQNLLRNFFGSADRAELLAAQKNAKAAKLTEFDSLQSLVLEALALFWQAYIAQENFKETVAARDRYEQLVTVVKRKASLGYANPGELPQVQAEYENRVQAVKLESLDYLEALDKLVTLLNLPSGTEVDFSVSDKIPAPPDFAGKEGATKKVDVENLRSLRALREKIAALNSSIRASVSRGYPDLSLIGRYSTAGVNESAQDSFNEMTSGIQPEYYIGLRFAFTFGSGSTTAEVRHKTLQKQIEESKLSRGLLERRDLIMQSERKVLATYGVALSTKRQKELREKAAQEIQKSYNQGRVDISILIDSLNKFFASGVSHTRAIGDYQLALNQWNAAKDEMINEGSDEVNKHEE
jgi:outer membrane protein TolC